jgi:hypothetical protein
MEAHLTVVSALALGVDPEDPLLERLHDTFVDGGKTWQYQIVGTKVQAVEIGLVVQFVSLCPSLTELQYRKSVQRSMARAAR